MMMSNRTNPYAVPGNPIQVMFDYGQAVKTLGLEHSLMALVEIRASQLNGCAACLLWHTRDTRQHGETEARIYLLEAWRESPLYSDRERAAIAWTEALTLMDRRDMDEAYDLVAAEFTLEEQVHLNLLIVMINCVNRVNAGFAGVPPAAAEDRRAA